jgi:hypothetical protein
VLNIKLQTNEIIKPITGYENLYYISNLGRVFNKTKELKTFIQNNGYEVVKLSCKSKAKHFTIHRLVATHFLPNPNNLPEVNHIDGVKTHNYDTNLEFVTSSGNKQHAIATGLKVYNNPTIGIKLGSSSVYKNVAYDINRNKWAATVRHNNQNLEQKRFDTEIEAANHVNYIIKKYALNRPLNVI